VRRTEDIQFTILVDNEAGEGLIPQRGFALHIAIGNTALLLDTGSGGALVHNAKKLGIDLAAVDYLILSHGHNDHSGGVPEFVEVNERAFIIHHSSILTPHFSHRRGCKDIACPLPSTEALLKLVSADRLLATTDGVILDEGIGITGKIPATYPDDMPGGPYFSDPAGTIPDRFPDEIALWIDTPQGLVIITGCCHKGLRNTIAAARAASNRDRVYAVMGGLHLAQANQHCRKNALETLQEASPELLVTCHCTGLKAADELRHELSSHVMAGYTGLQLSIPLAVPKQHNLHLASVSS
jgi:7,8-dihydropterin-6-yl-methyl-4-(beta-D-ribofuranosyl)aminobenzene 5'-phosphate synthase